MTKRSEKFFRQWQKENANCMRGFISIFDFRQGRSTQRLLSNRRRGNDSNFGITNARNKVDLPCKLEENHVDIQNVINISDTESDDAIVVNASISSISTLMEKEMSRAYHSRKEFRSRSKWIKAGLETGATSDNNHKEATKIATLSNKILNASSNLISQSDHPGMSVVLSSELDLRTFMSDYCSDFLECKNNPLECKERKTIKPFRHHQNQLLGNPPEIKMFQKQNDHYFLGKREKLTAVYQSSESDDAKGLERIVVLEPTHVRNQSLSNTTALISSTLLRSKQGQERLSSHFSLKEIRKSFRNVIGASRKEKHPIAMDGILHKIPYGKEVTSGTENGGEKKLDAGAYEKKNAFSVASDISDRKKLSKDSVPGLLYAECSFCDEARKDHVDFLRIGSENESLPPIHVSKTLGRLLSFPGFNYLSPRLGPSREKDKFLKENGSLLCCSNEKDDSEHLELFGKGESFPNSDKEPELKNEIMEIFEIEEVSQLEAQSVLISNEDDHVCDAFMEEGSSMLLEPEQSQARFEPSSPSTPITSKLPIIQGSKETESVTEDADRPSPISVLDPFFEDADISESMLSWRCKATNADAQKSQIDNSAAASGSTDAEEDLVSCTEFNEALLFDELEVSYSKCIDDPKLLFDSIDEVLTIIKERHFSFTPRVSVVKHKHEHFLKEARRRMDRHLGAQFPNTLEQIVKKDLDGTVWIDLQCGAENAVSEVGDYILDCLFEEIAVEL